MKGIKGRRQYEQVPQVSYKGPDLNISFHRPIQTHIFEKKFND